MGSRFGNVPTLVKFLRNEKGVAAEEAAVREMLEQEGMEVTNSKTSN